MNDRKEALTLEGNGVKLNVKDGWITCPDCRRRLSFLRLHHDTEARRLPIYCRSCRKEIIVNIAQGQSVERQSP